jgi:hypothetical protein
MPNAIADYATSMPVYFEPSAESEVPALAVLDAAELRELIASAMNDHHPTTGMAVASGVTCVCGYWTGSEPEAGKRPLPWGRDRLDLHRANVALTTIMGLTALQVTEARLAAAEAKLMAVRSWVTSTIPNPMPEQNPAQERYPGLLHILDADDESAEDA